MSTIRIAGISEESIVDGPGLRYVIFTQGCTHNCKGCHNPQTHNLKDGKLKPFQEILDEIDSNPLLSGVTFSGGEPFLQSEACFLLGQSIKEKKLHILTYTGFLFEDLLQLSKENSAILNFLSICDILIDGPFLLEQKDLLLQFKGSKNQRSIDVQKSLASGETILHDFT